MSNRTAVPARIEAGTPSTRLRLRRWPAPRCGYHFATARLILAAIVALSAAGAVAQTTRGTLAECQAVPGAVHIVTRPGGGCDAYTPKDLAKLPTHALVVVLTPAEQQAGEDAQEPQLADLRNQAQAAQDANAAFLAIPTPTNAQVLAHVKALSQQNNRIIQALVRLLALRRQ